MFRFIALLTTAIALALPSHAELKLPRGAFTHYELSQARAKAASTGLPMAFVFTDANTH